MTAILECNDKYTVVIEKNSLKNTSNDITDDNTAIDQIAPESVIIKISADCISCGKEISAHETDQSGLCRSCQQIDIGYEEEEPKPYVCERCGQRFALKATLKRHSRVHTDNKPYQCSQCSKQFKHIHGLHTHMRIHTGEKPFQCKFCQKTFAQLSTLSKHLRIHTGEQPYQCDFCGRYFSRTDTLKNHIRTHTKKKPFNCAVCGRSYSRHDNLLVHVLTHNKSRIKAGISSYENGQYYLDEITETCATGEMSMSSSKISSAKLALPEPISFETVTSC